jgi:hypothetical protein
MYLNAQLKKLEGNDNLKENYISQTNQKYSQDKSELSGEYRKQLKKIYYLRKDVLIKRAQSNHFIFDADVLSYFGNIIDEIKSKNRSYNYSDLRVVLSREPNPNAFSTGEGTIAINLGLLPQIGSEQELVFIICHEIAHYILNHTNDFIVAQFDKNKEFAKEIDKINEEEYYRASKLKEIYKENLYAENLHSRNDEFAADSIGFILYSKTKYACKALPMVMTTLENLSLYIDTSQHNIYELLNFSKMPTYSTIMENTKVNRHYDFDVSLMKSHPDLDKRQAKLETFLLRTPSISSPSYTNSNTFNELKILTDKEIIESLNIVQSWDLAFLYALRKHLSNTEDLYFKNQAAKTLCELYYARKSHRIGLVASGEYEVTDTMHRALSSLLFRSRMTQFAKSALQFSETRIDLQDEYNLYLIILVSQGAGDAKKLNAYKSQYTRLFKKGLYIKEIKKINL